MALVWHLSHLKRPASESGSRAKVRALRNPRFQLLDDGDENMDNHHSESHPERLSNEQVLNAWLRLSSQNSPGTIQPETVSWPRPPPQSLSNTYSILGASPENPFAKTSSSFADMGDR